MMRLAIIGLGGISQSVHLPLIQRNRASIDLVAAVELSPSRLATIGDRYAIPVEGRFATLEALIAAISSRSIEVDTAIIATAGGHTDEALELIRAGVKVLVEKPLGWSFQDLDALETGLASLGKDATQWLRVGYMKEHDPAVSAARALLAEVTAREVRVEVMHPADGAQIRFARLGEAPQDLDSGAVSQLGVRGQRSITEAVGTDDEILRKLWSNVVLGSVIHDIALTRHLGFGLSTVASARRQGTDFPGSVFAAGATEAGVPWNLGWHFITDYPEYRETVTVHHERGTVELQFATPYILNAPTVLRVCTGGDELSSQVSERTWPQEEAFERQLESLLAMHKGEPTGGSSLHQARQDLTSAWALWRACADSAALRTGPGGGSTDPSAGTADRVRPAAQTERKS